MKIQCECGKFQAELSGFPKNSPGHLACYCDDCQTYLHYLARPDLLEPAGGTVIVPVYPKEIKILQGTDVLKCTKLMPKGMFRFSTTCCNTPIGNSRPGFPWFGLLKKVYTVKDPDFLQKTLGPIKSAVQGRFAQGTPPPGTSNNLVFKDFVTVMPFLIKGFLTGKPRPNPFFKINSDDPIVPAYTLTLEERMRFEPRSVFQRSKNRIQINKGDYDVR